MVGSLQIEKCKREWLMNGFWFLIFKKTVLEIE